ncbi:MAG: four helix bundle protein [Bacteroidetes bacterium]|nr:four helix bundle protein [Bacteroidota bacterium]
MRKASVSILLNISEGLGRKSHKEFKQFAYFFTWFSR